MIDGKEKKKLPESSSPKINPQRKQINTFAHMSNRSFWTPTTPKNTPDKKDKNPQIMHHPRSGPLSPPLNRL
jgi:hypothetical protein